MKFESLVSEGIIISLLQAITVVSIGGNVHSGNTGWMVLCHKYAESEHFIEYNICSPDLKNV